MDYLSEKIRVIVQQLSLLRQSEPEPLEGVTYLPAGYKASNTPPEGRLQSASSHMAPSTSQRPSLTRWRICW